MCFCKIINDVLYAIKRPVYLRFVYFGLQALSVLFVDNINALLCFAKSGGIICLIQSGIKNGFGYGDFDMEYRVVEWTPIRPHTTCCFVYVELTDAIKQAIVNDIRKDGYMFDTRELIGGDLQVVPVLNTGEAVMLSDELCEELICRAYGFSKEDYDKRFDHVANNPFYELVPSNKFICEYPLKIVVWINDDIFDDFKASILGGNSNVDIIPDDYIQLKKGDVIRYTSVDESKYFEVQVKDFLPGYVTKISDIAYLDDVNTEDIINLISHNNYIAKEPLLYRYEGLNGQDVYEEFERIYGTWLLKELAFGNGFDCRINFIVFDKNITFEQTVLDMPDDIAVSEEVLNDIEQQYQGYLSEVARWQEENRQRMLRLKEKMAKRKKEVN